VAVAEDERLKSFLEQGLRAVRGAFPERPVELLQVADVAEAVRRGKARLGVMSADGFFDDSGQLEERGVEAVAVLGATFLHLVRRADDPRGGIEGAVGVSEHLVAVSPAESFAGTEPARTGTLAELLDALRASEIDAVMTLEASGDARLLEHLDGLRLVDVPSSVSTARPYFRSARLPPAVYPRQTATLESAAIQVVLVGPSSERRVSVTGPGAALPEAALPLSLEQARALAQASGVWETPQAGLPSVWRSAMQVEKERPLENPLVSVTLNLITILFLALVFFLLVKAPIGCSLAAQEPQQR
jgi:hypothetical protein